MLDYLQTMFDLALRKELQGLHFWATVYVLVVLLGTVWHVLRVRRWPCTQGQLLRLGVRDLTDEGPSLADGGYRGSLHNPWGRYFYVNITKSF